MSASGDNEKTEEPTEKRLRDAVDRGQIPVAREVSTLAGLLAISAVLTWTWPFGLDPLVDAFQSLLDHAADYPLVHGVDAFNLATIMLVPAATALMPIVLTLLAAGIAASILQNPPAMVADRIAPKLSRISLSAGAKRIFGQPGLVEFTKAVAKLVLVAAALALVMSDVPATLISGMSQHPAAFSDVVWRMAMQVVLLAVAVMAPLAAADMVWSRFDWRRQLRMSRQELKDEAKQAEGDPIIRARLRSLGRDRARRRMMRAVETATLVVANPTHFAVALRYERGRDAAPVVVAKGQDLVALRIREIAEANGVSVFEDVALARSLHRAVKVDQTIPPAFFVAVAELVRIVHAAQAASRRV